MKSKQFEQIINRQFNNCRDLLVTKGKEYTPDKDVFEVFNKAATLSGEGGRKAALFNFLLKHLVSISDMCHSNETYSMDRWNEKITDAMNYLLLLKAMVEEDEIFRNDSKWGEEYRKTAHGFERVPDKPSYASWDEIAKAVEEDEIPENDSIRAVTGYTTEELAEKLANTEIRFDQIIKKCFDDCNECPDANCDGSDESFINCNNNCNGCIHLSCGRRADSDELLEEATAEDWEEFWKDVGVEVKITGAAELETSKDCKNCDMAIWSLNADKNKDKPVCFKKALGECDGDARVPGPISLVQDKATSKKYSFEKHRCGLDFPYCVLGGPEECSTCKYWEETKPSLSIEEEIARAKALEDDLK